MQPSLETQAEAAELEQRGLGGAQALFLRNIVEQLVQPVASKPIAELPTVKERDFACG